MLFFLMSLLSVAIIGGAAAVGGGGGGGGGGGSGSTLSGSYSLTPPPADKSIPIGETNSYKTGEYTNQWGLGAIKAAEAYKYLASQSKSVAGDGITIAITDTGVDSTHREINPNYDAVNSVTTPSGDWYGHGTHVASIAAGVKDGAFMHGVAFNAKIMSVRVALSGDPDYSLSMPTKDGVKYAADHNAQVANMSWGSYYPNIVIGDGLYIGALTNFTPALTAAKASNGGKGMVMVASTGNDNDANHVGIPALFAQDAATNGQMIAVASIDQAGTLSSFSNGCKQAQSSCLSAPGGSIYAAIPGSPYYQLKNGTSMAAPHVTGAVAVLRAAWPLLTATESVDIILSTTTRTGIYSNRDVYGQGLLNLEEAVKPQGPSSIPGSNTVSSAGSDATTSSISTNSIFGNSYAQNLAPILKNAVFFDKYGRDYKANLDQKISSVGNTPYNLENILLANNSGTSLPISFGDHHSNNLAVKFTARNTFSDPISGEIKHNQFGLKHLTVDRSKEDQNSFNSSDVAFSYSKNFQNNTKLSFSKNDFNEEFSTNNPAKNFNLISYGNFNSNPYKQLNSVVATTGDIKTRINNNQLNISQNLTPNLISSLSFSSYNYSNSISKFSSDESRIFDSGLSYKFGDKTQFSANFGNLKELGDNLLGSKAQGAFSGGSNPQTKYASLNITRNLLNNWQLTTSYSEGKTNVGGNSLGVFRDFSDIKSRGMAIGLLNSNIFNGKLGIVYSEPLRVYKGTTNINIPISRDDQGNVQRMTANGISLKPDGKEKDLEFSYSFSLKSNDSTINLNSIIQQQPNNIKNAKDQYVWMMRYDLKY